MTRSLALVRDPAAPRSVVVLIGPCPRRCQRVLSTNRRTTEHCVHRGKTPVFSVAYAMLARRPAIGSGKGAKNFWFAREKNWVP